MKKNWKTMILIFSILGSSFCVMAQSDGGFSLDDLEEEVNSDNQKAVEWEEKQKKMSSAFEQVNKFDQRSRVRLSLKVKAWQRFLSYFSEDNPYSTEDDQQRENAKQQMSLRMGKSQSEIVTAPSLPTINTDPEVVIEPETKAKELVKSESNQTDISSAALDLEKEWIEPNTGLKFVRIAGGNFEMGDLFREGGGTEKPIRTVTLGDYWLSTMEVNQAQWGKIMMREAKVMSAAFRGEDKPVMLVNFAETQEFMLNLDKLHQNKYGFRLPSEAEWEYACREGGKKVRFGTGKKKLNKQDAQFGGKMRTMPVGSFKPNALGLYDMAGNLQEWVFDGVTKGWGYKLVVDETDNPMIEGEKVMRYARGGSWMSIFKDARCARRRAYGAESPHTTVGFRVAIPGPESARAR